MSITIEETVLATHSGLREWLQNPAIQSRATDTIVKVALDLPIDPYAIRTPIDVQDFHRCSRLLQSVPSLQPLFKEKVAKSTPNWKAFATHWGSLHAILVLAVPGYQTANPDYPNANTMRYETAKYVFNHLTSLSQRDLALA